MTQATQTWTEADVDVAGNTVHYLQAGSGAPLWIVHHDIGNPGWLPFYEKLAERCAVTVADLPGYGKSARPDWMRTVRDQAVMTGFIMDHVLEEPGTLLGLGFGGWIAAELATMRPAALRKLVLVNPAGLKPREGLIFDQFLVNHWEYILQGFRDNAKAEALWGAEPEVDQLVEWDFAREMTTRIAWKPYMFNQELPHLLSEMRVPTLVVTGADDAVVPPLCGQQYVEALPDARLETVAEAGHFVEIEQPDQLAALVGEFIAAR